MRVHVHVVELQVYSMKQRKDKTKGHLYNTIGFVRSRKLKAPCARALSHNRTRSAPAPEKNGPSHIPQQFVGIAERPPPPHTHTTLKPHHVIPIICIAFGVRSPLIKLVFAKGPSERLTEVSRPKLSGFALPTSFRLA